MDLGEWIAVEGFPGYSVNPLGQIKKDSTGRLLHTRINQYGVPYVGLMREWRQCIRSLPRLVATAFVEQPNEIFDTPINLDGDRSNCHVDNLQWRPRWYAVLYNNQFRERYQNPISAPVREVKSGKTFADSFEAGCYFGVLEREVVLSILNHTLAWPTYQQFELIE